MKDNKFLIVSYLLYIIFWEVFILGGSAYLVFILNKPTILFIIGLILSFCCFKPENWRKLIDETIKTAINEKE